MEYTALYQPCVGSSIDTIYYLVYSVYGCVVSGTGLHVGHVYVLTRMCLFAMHATSTYIYMYEGNNCVHSGIVWFQWSM